jgi:hypothetical protein
VLSALKGVFILAPLRRGRKVFGLRLPAGKEEGLWQSMRDKKSSWIPSGPVTT